MGGLANHNIARAGETRARNDARIRTWLQNGRFGEWLTASELALLTGMTVAQVCGSLKRQWPSRVRKRRRSPGRAFEYSLRRRS